MKFKVGDRVRIRSREWIDAQPKDKDGDIEVVINEPGNCRARNNEYFTQSMFRHAGMNAVITSTIGGTNNDPVERYCIDIDGGSRNWTAEMFEPTEASV